MSDLTKILAENQTEMLTLIAPSCKEPVNHRNSENSASETTNVLPLKMSTPVRHNTTAQKTTPVKRRNSDNVFNIKQHIFAWIWTFSRLFMVNLVWKFVTRKVEYCI